MATQVRHQIQDENMNVHRKGRDAKASKVKKSVGLGGLKPLRNITNSGKPSPPKMKVKNNLNNSQVRVAIENENFSTGCEGVASVAGKKSIIPKAQKNAGIVGGRKALSNITNTSKSSPLIPTRKNHPKKIINIDEEQCLHNHQECINLQTSGEVDMNLLLSTIGFQDDWASSPMFSVSRQAKGEIASSPQTPMFLELEEITPLPKNIWRDSNLFPSPSPDRVFSTSKFALRLRDF